MVLQLLSHFSRAGTEIENSFWSEVFLNIRDESIRLVFPELRLCGFLLRLIMIYFECLVGKIVGENQQAVGAFVKSVRVLIKNDYEGPVNPARGIDSHRVNIIECLSGLRGPLKFAPDWQWD
jgi:hypothetical protein